MGAKPSPVANAGGGPGKPLENGQSHTTNAIIRTRSSQLAAVLKQEAQNK